eukprot:SAG31_NODE_17115_length_683_cov_0.720890_2_plen_43_part_01
MALRTLFASAVLRELCRVPVVFASFGIASGSCMVTDFGAKPDD